MVFPVTGLPVDVIDELEIAAAQRGISRNAYVVELLVSAESSSRPLSSLPISEIRKS
ncbi:MAG: hypothetical protein ACRDRH_15235 [Pseudonocardia sp.]